MHRLDAGVECVAAERHIERRLDGSVILAERRYMLLLVRRERVVNRILHTPALTGGQVWEVGDAGQSDGGRNGKGGFQSPPGADAIPWLTAFTSSAGGNLDIDGLERAAETGAGAAA